ncbi:helix-turn-helix transcriptional regulator [Ramlibacter sp. AW1]|uniref:Helix-turn-helix transcriptional regulator n=1 Tax=Ramlibacter aurantiacus TaxID=2801330 RepID=A0A937D077_9BURK|nr:helix-turn-helix transcriptional regulator [Ramlibacter aurantiacus]MBL0419134.1 helix-turn-helix transcriptional regulator [Ramlibacter aurantiacus]
MQALPTIRIDRAIPLPSLQHSEVIAALIDGVGQERFAHEALRQLNRLLPAGSFSAYVLSRRAAPELIASASLDRPDRTREVWTYYQARLYRQDSSFDAAWACPAPQLTHCTKSAFVPEHQMEIYERSRSRERLSLTMPVETDQLLAINFYRHVDQPGFTPHDTDVAAAIAMPLIACVRQHLRWGQRRRPLPLRERLRHSCGRLTERELDVLEQISAGATYEDMARALGVSATTAKTYRERAFIKLGIERRSELGTLLLGQA